MVTVDMVRIKISSENFRMKEDYGIIFLKYENG